MAKIASTNSTKKSASNGAANPTKQQILGDTASIERLAYQFFVERGYQHGHDREDWSRAEAVIKKRNRT